MNEERSSSVVGDDLARIDDLAVEFVDADAVTAVVERARLRPVETGRFPGGAVLPPELDHRGVAEAAL